MSVTRPEGYSVIAQSSLANSGRMARQRGLLQRRVAGLLPGPRGRVQGSTLADIREPDSSATLERCMRQCRQNKTPHTPPAAAIVPKRIAWFRDGDPSETLPPIWSWSCPAVTEGFRLASETTSTLVLTCRGIGGDVTNGWLLQRSWGPRNEMDRSGSSSASRSVIATPARFSFRPR